MYAQRPLPLPEHIGLSLVLHKVVDQRQAVRDSARGLLGMLARRAWGRDARYRWASRRYTPGGAAPHESPRGIRISAMCQALQQCCVQRCAVHERLSVHAVCVGSTAQSGVLCEQPSLPLTTLCLTHLHSLLWPAASSMTQGPRPQLLPLAAFPRAQLPRQQLLAAPWLWAAWPTHMPRTSCACLPGWLRSIMH